jgi:dimethylaniline monooxygenase (N-oxide forming)
MKSTFANTSKEMMAFSDFAPKPETPVFMHHSLYNQYLNDYADQYELKPCIQFDTGVEEVDQTT